MPDVTVDETEGTQYEQKVARRLSRADKVRDRDILMTMWVLGMELFVIILELGVGLFLSWKALATYYP